MKKLAGVMLLLLTQPAWSGEDPPGCAWLCGNWVLDTARSEAVEPVVDAALARYKEAGRQAKTLVRTQLVALLTPAAALTLAEQGDQVLIRAGDHPERRVFPGEPHSRVDAQGTAKVRADWKKDALVVNESYDSKHEQAETFALLPDGTLQVTLVMERPEAKSMRLRSVYRRR
jgi:hypothetical protein